MSAFLDLLCKRDVVGQFHSIAVYISISMLVFDVMSENVVSVHVCIVFLFHFVLLCFLLGLVFNNVTFEIRGEG